MLLSLNKNHLMIKISLHKIRVALIDCKQALAVIKDSLFLNHWKFSSLCLENTVKLHQKIAKYLIKTNNVFWLNFLLYQVTMEDTITSLIVAVCFTADVAYVII